MPELGEISGASGFPYTKMYLALKVSLTTPILSTAIALIVVVPVLILIAFPSYCVLFVVGSPPSTV